MNRQRIFLFLLVTFSAPILSSGGAIGALRPEKDAEGQSAEEEATARGLGASAASVYGREHGLSVAGYGEMLYEDFAAKDEAGASVDEPSKLDFLRAILYVGYRFDERFLFNSGIGFDQASAEGAGATTLEFAYVEYMVNEHLSVRGGRLLVPMGLVNEFHEPDAFIGAKRSETEQRIIPTTWGENGLGFLGSFGSLHYRAYLLEGLDARGFGPSGIRGGRQKGGQGMASDWAGVVRVDITPIPGVLAGISLYRGGADHGAITDAEGKGVGVTTTIYEAHAQIQLSGFELRGLFATARVSNVARLDAALELEPGETVGEEMFGSLLQLTYDVFSLVPSTGMRLSPFVRYEFVDTHQRVPHGFAPDPAQEVRLLTFGIAFLPIEDVVLEGEYQLVTKGDASGVDQFNLALGYSF
ncbi:MAG: hypothetical protein D6795_15845 [Deltaproteobacteria bacterium]|nr:MAG: hypothetical protein D6795_15845 [Deltaproteobacteria bacterium]